MKKMMRFSFSSVTVINARPMSESRLTRVTLARL
jgi:hypothetical protein